MKKFLNALFSKQYSPVHLLPYILWWPLAIRLFNEHDNWLWRVIIILLFCGTLWVVDVINGVGKALTEEED